MRKLHVKRMLVMAVCMILIFAMTACNKKSPSERVSTSIYSSENTTAETEAVTTETVETTAAPTEETTTETVEETTTETIEETTVVQTTEATEAPVPEGPKAWDLLNNEPLNPTTSGYEELDNLVAGFLAGVVTDQMSPYQKVWACYSWFIKNITYNRGMDVNAGQYSSSDPATTPVEVLWATDLLNTYQGCCYNYSSAFMYIMRALGYDAHLLSGQVGAYGGGTTPHCWLYVNLDGTAYTFDPDVDMNYYWRNIELGKEVMDTLFCKNMDSMSYFYTIETYHTN